MLNEYVVIVSNYNGDDTGSLDTSFIFYRNKKIDTAVYITKDGFDKNYVKEFTEFLRTEDATIKNYIVTNFDEVLTIINDLCQIFYDFEDHSILFLWEGIDDYIREKINIFSNIGDEDQESNIGFTELSDIIQGKYTIEQLFINHEIADELYECEDNVLTMNIAFSELLNSLFSRNK